MIVRLLSQTGPTLSLVPRPSDLRGRKKQIPSKQTHKAITVCFDAHAHRGIITGFSSPFNPNMDAAGGIFGKKCSSISIFFPLKN